MQLSRLVLLAVFVIGVSGILTDSVFARRGGGFSSRRSYSPSRSSMSSRSGSWSNKRPWQSHKPKPKPRPKPRPDRSTSNEEAKKAFVQQHRDKYKQKPTPGEPAPAKRPSYIPSNTTVDGRQYDVTYNVGQGGYGYWNGGAPGLGTWMMYDALSDAAMVSMLMRQNDPYHAGVAHTQATSSAGAYRALMPILGLVILGIIIVWGYRSYTPAHGRL